MSDTLDTTDIDRWLGVPFHRNGAVEPVHVNEIRRWAQAMHHPNPLFYNEAYAAESRFGRIVAPQSFTIVTEAGHGARPAVQGHIPQSHMLFAGDEWWFFGPRIFPGDTLTVDQMAFDYRRTTTSFAGPAVIQRGDNHYVNQKGEKVAIQRSAAVRYQPAAAREAAAFTGQEDEPDWSDEELEAIIKERHDYVSSILSLGHDPRGFDSVEVGDELPVKVMGPHSVVSFATEWRAYTMNLWNAMYRTPLVAPSDSGWTAEMSVNEDHAAWDPEFADGAYYGASRGHLDSKYARRIGMPRAYGYGASLGAWALDYLGSWAGEWGFVEHSKCQYRAPALVGDVTYMKGTVTAKSDALDRSQGRVHIDFLTTNQRDEVLVRGSGEVLLPRD